MNFKELRKRIKENVLIDIKIRLAREKLEEKIREVSKSKKPVTDEEIRKQMDAALEDA